MPTAPRSLVRKLVLTFLLPSLVILALGAVFAYFRTATALRESVFERLDAVATVKATALDVWVEHLVHDVVLLSELPELAELTSDLSGEVPEARRLAADERLSRLVNLTLERTPSFTEFFFLAPIGGEVLVSTDSRHEGQFRIYDRYYVEGRKAPFVQNVYPSPVTLQPTLTISAPVRTESGEILGVLAAHLSLEYLDQNILGRTGLGRSGGVTLVDRYKVVVTGERYGNEATVAGTTSVAIEEVIQGHAGVGLYRDSSGAEVIGAYRWLEDRELGLIVEIHQREAFSLARRLALSILAVGSLVLTLLVAGVNLAARRIARPILAITDAAARVREGNLSTRASASTDDEIGALAETFNGMIEQLAADAKAREEAEAIREALIAELEAKNAELERFAYTASHDLKSPLLTIKGFLGYLKRDFESGRAERARTDMERIEGAVEKMERLLNELLELSRIGRVVNEPEEVCLRALSREIAESIAEREAGRVEITVDEALPVVFGDCVRLREVLENLVENAVKFMGAQSSPLVEIGVRRDGEETVLYVRDNGAGIAPEYQEKVFGLFDRLDPSVEGTGVGLAIVRRIVEVHGGRIWVESEGENRGSMFCFTLPEG
ncbi:MAG: HAMP domain-containing protein [bacterium]|nr:HAMP domain-containing protein [bacterium]